MQAASPKALNVGIVGAGPVGLYAAYRLVKDGHKVVLFERGEDVAGNMRSWSFVRLFSKMELNVPEDVRKTLEAEYGKLKPAGVDEAEPWEFPKLDEYLTGGDFVRRVLAPLAEWLKRQSGFELRLGHEVVSVGRGRLLKGDGIMAINDKRRLGAPFRVLSKLTGGEAAALLGDNGAPRRTRPRLEAVETGLEVLIDASGSYGTATGNHVGVGGMAALGEAAAEEAGLLRRVIPDVKASAELIKGKRVAVIGTGYSAITCLRNLCDVPQETAPSQVYWLTRRPQGKPPYSILDDDPLPQRSELAKFGNKLVQDNGKDFGGTKFEYIPAMGIGSMEQVADGLKMRLEVENSKQEIEERELDVDVLFSLTGFHPDMGLWSELQVHMCYASDGPMNLAATLLAAKVAMEGDPAAAGDCLKQAAPGPKTLENPEPDFYVLGMKSYGRNSSFLMRVGYEQVDLLSKKLRGGDATA